MSGIDGLLRCPACGSPGMKWAKRVTCKSCSASFPAEDGIAVLLPPSRDPVRARIASYYDDNAGEYEQSHGIGGPGGAWSITHKYIPFLKRHLLGTETALEVGAGTGLVTRELAKLVRTVLPSDISPGMLRHGRERNGLGEAVAADAQALPFNDSVFDATIAINALSYCVDKGKALAEVFRVLKPGGVLLMIDMNYLLHLPYHLLAIKEWNKARLWTPQLLESTPWGWRKRATRAGFVIQERLEFNWVPHRFRDRALENAIRLDRALSRIPLLRSCAMRVALAARRPFPRRD